MQKIPQARADRILRALGKAKSASATLEEYASTEAEIQAVEIFQSNIKAIRKVVMDAPKLATVEKTEPAKAPSKK